MQKKEYRLTSRQKDLAKKVRKSTVVGGLAVTTLIGALAIGANISNHISKTAQENAYENTILDRKTVLNEATSTLTNIVLPNGGRNGATVNFPSKDEFDKINSVQVNETVDINSHSIYRYFTGHKYNKNNPKIVNEFLDKLLAVSNTSTPSQKDLAKLQELTDKISEMNLALDGNNIIDLDEKNNDFER